MFLRIGRFGITIQNMPLSLPCGYGIAFVPGLFTFLHQQILHSPLVDLKADQKKRFTTTCQNTPIPTQFILNQRGQSTR